MGKANVSVRENGRRVKSSQKLFMGSHGGMEAAGFAPASEPKTRGRSGFYGAETLSSKEGSESGFRDKKKEGGADMDPRFASVAGKKHGSTEKTNVKHNQEKRVVFRGVLCTM